MKKLFVMLLITALCFCMCGCLTSNSDSGKNSEAWDDGYEAGYQAGKEDAEDALYGKMSNAAEKIGKALAIMEDLPSKAYKIDGMDDLYDAIAKADNALSGYR